jgi:capsule polysaccharide export protein KpsE/RkpR
MNLMAVIVVFRFLMSASVDTPASQRAFQVRQTANTSSASLISRLWVGSSFFNTALDAEP